MSAVYIVRTCVQAAHEAEWLAWQEQEHVPNLLQLNGYHGVQRFRDLDRAATYLNLWRIEDRSAQQTDGYRTASLTAWFDRIRPHYDVSVEFSREAHGSGLEGGATWRDGVAALVLDRWDPDSGVRVEEAEAALVARRHEGVSGVLHVARLDRLLEGGVPAPRSAPSGVLLHYLDSVEAADRSGAAPAGLERRRYAALGPYQAGRGR